MPFLIYKINICLDPFLFFLIIFINIYMYLLLLFLLLLQLFELYYMICTVPLYCTAFNDERDRRQEGRS